MKSPKAKTPKTKKKKVNKTEHLHERIRPDLKSLAQERAKSEGRTFGNWLEFLIKRELKFKD